MTEGHDEQTQRKGPAVVRLRHNRHWRDYRRDNGKGRRPWMGRMVVDRRDNRNQWKPNAAGLADR